MKIHNITEAINYADPDPRPEQDIVDKFADVDPKLRSYYIMKWAEKKGIDSDDAMFMAGYVHDGYIGAGAWNWRYVGMEESVQEDDNDVNDSGIIGEPDNYYDEEERKEAYNKMQDALDHADRHEHDYVMDGVCPNCAGSGYQDGEDEIWDEEEGEYVEGNECDGWGNYGCDEGQMIGASWREIMDHDIDRQEREEIKNRPQPSDEILAGAMKQLHKNYVETGKINAFELPSLLRQMYPEISKGKAREIGGKFFKDFSTMNDPEPVTEASEGEAMVAKMLAKALGDENRWTEMSAAELYAELESAEPKKADMIALVAKMLYDVKLQERAYKDVGVADVVKDPRGKEFKFDKDSKQFKSVDGEKASVSTKLGRELMRLRKNQMQKSTPSYNKKKFEAVANEETYECDDAFFEDYGYLGYSIDESDVFEAEYRGRKVKLNKPMQGDVKKFKVYVKDPKTGNVKKVNFGHGGSSVKGKAMKIRKNNPKARKSFRARHNCDNPGPKTKARYWSCRKW